MPPTREQSEGLASRIMVVFCGCVLTILCGLADWFTGPEIASSVFYLIPVAWVAWRGGRGLGVAMSVVCGQTWLLVEMLANTAYSYAFIPYWNGLVRLVIFCVVALLVSEIVERRRAEQALRLARDESDQRAARLAESEATLARQRGILQSVLDSMAEGVVVVDGAGNIMLSNPAAQRLMELGGANLDGGNHPLAQLLRRNPTQNLEIFLPRGDAGEEICLMVNGRPLNSADSEISGGVLVFKDITSLRALERQIAEVSDREQRRLGQDLHDGLCQHLVSMAFAARTLADKLQDNVRPEAMEANRIAESLNDAITQARDVARGLYLVQLEVGGLSSALEELAAHVTTRHRLSCTFIDRARSPVAETFAATDLFRIAQEAVTNAVKHARASAITISLATDENHVALEVRDNGIGIGKLPSGRGMGMHIMQYRARMIGAVCAVDGGAEGGTVVTCTIQRRSTELRTDNE